MMRILYRKSLITSTLLASLIFNLIILVSYNSNQKQGKINVLTIDKYEETSKDELRNMIKYMFRAGAFLIDVNYLKELMNETYITTSEKLSKDYIRSFFKRDQYMVFGLIADNFSIFNDKDLKESFNMTCTITKTKGHLINQTVDTNIYFTCPNVKVQVSLFHERSEYLWIGQDEESEEKTPLWFGDTPRAVQYIENHIVKCYKNDLIYLPVHLKKFLFDYQHSKFYECHHEIANEMKIQLKGNHTKPEDELLRYKYGLQALSEILEGLYKPYIINAGTLLGWYRQCNIIPYTTDVDFSMKLDDYDISVKKALLGNKKIPLVRIFGTPKYGLEFRLVVDQLQFDLFFLTNLNSSHFWTGFHFPTKYLKQYHRRFNEFCSCELLGIKLLIPCEPENTILYNFGPNWSKPKDVGGWSSVDFVQYHMFDNKDWKDKLKVYDKHGNLQEQEAIDYLNSRNEGIRPVVQNIIDDVY